MRLFSVLSIGLIILVSACAVVTEKSQLRVDGVAFHNATTSTVAEVRLSVRKIGGVVSCGPILVGSSCSTTFPVRDYQGNSITVHWTQDDEDRSSEPFVIDMPPVVIPNRPATAVITLGVQGAVSARLIQ